MRTSRSLTIAATLLSCAGTAAARIPVDGEWAQSGRFVEPDPMLEQDQSLRETESVPFSLEGQVRAHDGPPAKGAMGASTAGGQGETNSRGVLR